PEVNAGLRPVALNKSSEVCNIPRSEPTNISQENVLTLDFSNIEEPVSDGKTTIQIEKRPRGRPKVNRGKTEPVSDGKTTIQIGKRPRGRPKVNRGKTEPVSDGKTTIQIEKRPRGRPKVNCGKTDKLMIKQTEKTSGADGTISEKSANVTKLREKSVERIESTMETCLANKVTQFKLKYCTKPCSLKLHRVENVYRSYGNVKIDLYPVKDTSETYLKNASVILKPSYKRKLIKKKIKASPKCKKETNENQQVKLENEGEEPEEVDSVVEDSIPSDDENDVDFDPWKYVEAVYLGDRKDREKRACTANLNLNQYQLEEVNISDDYFLAKEPKRETSTSKKKPKVQRVKRTRSIPGFRMKRKSEDSLKCRLCPYVGVSKLDRAQHTVQAHPTKKCKLCDKLLRAESDFYYYHMTKMHGGEKHFKCDFENCSYASSNKQDLRKHKRHVHSTEFKYVCDICGHRSNYERNIKYHKIKHSNERPFPCSLCPYRAKQRQDLAQHMLTHSHEKPLKCDTCDFTCKRNWELTSHRLSHSDVKPFKCNHPGCTAATKTNSDLVKHMRTHKTIRDFICHLCQKGYKDKASLNKHVRFVHVGEKKFECDNCGNKFKSKISLKKHMMVHADIRPFKCNICGHRVRTRRYLAIHMVTHDLSSRPYVCPLCPFGAPDPMNLLPHIGAYHSEYCYFCELCRKPFKRYRQLLNHLEREREHSREEVEKMRSNTDIDMSLLNIEIVNDDDEDRKPLAESQELTDETKKAIIGDINVQKECKIDAEADTGHAKIEPESEVDQAILTDIKTEPLEDVMHETVSQNFMESDQDKPLCVNDSDGKKIVLIALYGDLRLSLATKGFAFNYDKNGKKPKTWFMDYKLMNQEDAEKQKKYLRKTGVLPPIPRGHPPKGYKRLSKFLKNRRKKFEEHKKKRVTIRKRKLEVGSDSEEEVSLNKPKRVKREDVSKALQEKTSEGKNVKNKVITKARGRKRINPNKDQTLTKSGRKRKSVAKLKVAKKSKTVQSVKKDVLKVSRKAKTVKASPKTKKGNLDVKSKAKKAVPLKKKKSPTKKGKKNVLKVKIGHGKGGDDAERNSFAALESIISEVSHLDNLKIGAKQSSSPKKQGKAKGNVKAGEPKYKYVPVKPPKKRKLPAPDQVEEFVEHSGKNKRVKQVARKSTTPVVNTQPIHDMVVESETMNFESALIGGIKQEVDLQQDMINGAQLLIIHPGQGGDGVTPVLLQKVDSYEDDQQLDDLGEHGFLVTVNEGHMRAKSMSRESQPDVKDFIVETNIDNEDEVGEDKNNLDKNIDTVKVKQELTDE
ncbi:ZFP26-like protein, partial [Mya arenaria]